MRSEVYRDFDAFAESVRDIDCDMMLRNPACHEWSTSAATVGKIDVQIGRLGSGNIAQGQLRSDGFMFYVPLTSGVQYTANGVQLPTDACAVMEPGCEFCFSTQVAHDWCAIFVPTKQLSVDGRPITLLEEKRNADCRVTAPNRAAANQFRATARQILAAAQQYTRFESSRAAEVAADDVVRVISGLVGGRSSGQPSSEGRPRASRKPDRARIA